MTVVTVKLPRAFYDRPTLDVARDLIGKVLVHNRRGVRTSGVIVEVEAYIGESDPACHAAPGPTRRNAPLYGPPGHAYVYLNYGIHCLVNVVTEAEGLTGRGADSRARAARRDRRHAPAPRANGEGEGGTADRELANHELCRGPGNLTMAMGISLAENQLDLLGDRIFLEDRGLQSGRLAWGPRIGIRVGTVQPWRVYVGNPAVSGGGRLDVSPILT